MNEVHSPKKPLIFYYMVAMLLVMLFNFIAMPWLSQYQIQEVDYNTFVSMTETDRNSASELVCILWIPAILAPCGRTVQKTICERKAADFMLETRVIGIFAAFFR